MALSVILLTQCATVQEAEPVKKSGEPDVRFRVVSLFYLSEKQEIQPAVAKAPPVRWIRTGERFHTRVVRTILTGPNEAERAAGFYVTYYPPGPTGFWPTTDPPAKPLKTYFNGVKIVDRTAIVDFDPAALIYLNAPAATQYGVKSPIRNTLLKLPEIDEVKFSIRGKVFTAWRA